ncbi:hypothetical protein B0J13DRAFT_587619 [Dactylonectria estremocensis]|uniref:Calpain catalytic domain-containing protein n=1 Tax=Dactylonectria estremocensis TaxID=1079267 RepID=A0A9P9E953_9HYPO|nr:hypothetical protein B0J13DRAFT_587619 [Dactylonectria estremocensis]
MEPPIIPPLRPKPKPPLSPQALVSKFWSRYHAKATGKVTSIFPRSLYEPLVSDSGPSHASARNAAQGYEEARSDCRARVRAIVAECERTNSRFSDPDFDIETDFFIRNDNCLYGLVREWESDDDNLSDPGSNVQAWQVKMSLDTLKDSGVLGNDKLEIDVGNLRRYLGPDHDCYNMPPPRPGSVHRLSWIFESPQFTVDGFSGTDIKQGSNGDCWWLAALATIAHRKDLMNKICVERDEECGVYGFVFHRDGEWISTVVDDNLYLKEKDFGQDSDIYDSTGKKSRLYKKQKQSGSDALFFAKCDDANETWLPLLEKAFAKVHGDYKAIDGGWAGTAVEDLTGGVTTVLAGNRVLRKERLWREMLRSSCEDAEFVFGLSASGPGIGSERNGLVLRHAYSILKATEVENEDGIKLRLVKIRNPWGQRSKHGIGEWHGPWADGSRQWTPYMIQKMRHDFGDDGIFWMSYDDVLEHFKWIYRTRLFDQRWNVVQQWTSIKVSWLTGYLKTRFIIEVKEEGMVVLALSQLDDRYFSDLRGQYDFSLQFLLKSVDSATPICHVRSANSWDRRSINCEINLEPGTYEVVPNIYAERDEDRPTVEQIVQAHADSNPQKLRQVGLQYDISHAKGGVLDEDVELQKKRAHEKKKQRSKKKKASYVNQVQQAMTRMEEVMLQMRKDMLRSPPGDSDGKDKDETNKDKNATDEKDSKKEGKSSKSSSVLLPEESFKTAAETRNKAEVNPKSKLETESSTIESNEKSEEDREKEHESPSRSSQPPVTQPKTNLPGKNAPRPDIKDVPSTPPPEIQSDPGQDSSDSESDSDDSDSDSDCDSDTSLELKKKKQWNAVCVLGLRVYAQHADVKIRLEEHDAKDAGSSLMTKDGNPVGLTS